MAERQTPENDVAASRPRPNSPWVCGHAALGHPCSQGPSKNGRCSLLQGLPKNQSEQDESCDGGANEAACEASDLLSQPCQPTKSAWFSRRTLSLNIALLCTGILLICMVSPQREALYVPGGLSQSHAQILGNTLVSERCGLCHPNSHDAKSGMTQDKLCMNCHSSHLPDASRRSSHDLTLAELKQILSLGQLRPVSSNSTAGSDLWNKETSCAQCHREHHGKQHDLQAITNERCQACHKRQFDSFEHGHPEFANYPNTGTRNIAFDHRAHAEEYFTQKNQSFDCKQCHFDTAKSGVVGSVFRTVGYEKACASCHDSAIRSGLTNGWAFLQVPCLPDADTKLSREFSEWPAEAVFDYDGSVSFAMRLLLASDPEMLPVLSRLPKNGNLSQVKASERPEIVRAVARSFRGLVNEIAAGGQTAWHNRLHRSIQATVGRQPNAHELGLIRQLTVGLPPDLFRHIEQQWFQSTNRIARAETLEQSLSTRLRRVSALLPRPRDDDELLNGNLSDEPSDESILQSEQAGPARQKLVRMKAASHLPEGGWYLDEQLLAVRYVAQGHADPFLSAWSELLHIVERSRGANQSESHSLPWRSRDAAERRFVPGSCLECHQLGENAASSDTWTNWRARVRPAGIRQFTKFDHTPHLSLPAVSDCRYCHELEGLSGSAKRKDLKGLLADELENSLKSESISNHMVHLEQFAKDYLGCEFVPMQRSQCVACHRPGGAGSGCTQCHNYHVGSEGFQWSIGQLHDAGK